MLDRCSPAFERLLDPFPLEEIELHAGSAYGMWPDFRLAYFNPAWVRFANKNGGDPAIVAKEYLGTSIIEAIPEVLRPFYRLMFLSCLHETRSRRRPIQHRYECSSARLAREFIMTLYRLKDAQGILVVNSLVVEGPHDPSDRVSWPPDRRVYEDEKGFISQCTHCRRVQHLEEPNRWDWVPAWVEQFPPRISHGLCPFCLEVYYLEPAGSRQIPASAKKTTRGPAR